MVGAHSSTEHRDHRPLDALDDQTNMMIMWNDDKPSTVMRLKRPRGVLALGWASLESAAAGRTEHRPVRETWPETVVRPMEFTAGGDLGWRISALSTPRATPAAWKIVVITGAPSWPEYWAPVMAALPVDREMVVVCRPGYGASGPADGAFDIETQALALSPLLATARGQKLMLVGQSYGGAIASLMAAAHPKLVNALVLLSPYLSEMGPTARRLVTLGNRVSRIIPIPRDLRHAVREVNGQPAQIHLMRAALQHVRAPIHVIHGDVDDFAPIEAARYLARTTRPQQPPRFVEVPGANHFMTDGEAESLIAILEACVPAAGWRARLRWPLSVGVAGGRFDRIALEGARRAASAGFASLVAAFGPRFGHTKLQEGGGVADVAVACAQNLG